MLENNGFIYKKLNKSENFSAENKTRKDNHE